MKVLKQFDSFETVLKQFANSLITAFFINSLKSTEVVWQSGNCLTDLKNSSLIGVLKFWSILTGLKPFESFIAVYSFETFWKFCNSITVGFFFYVICRKFFIQILRHFYRRFQRWPKKRQILETIFCCNKKRQNNILEV